MLLLIFYVYLIQSAWSESKLMRFQESLNSKNIHTADILLHHLFLYGGNIDDELIKETTHPTELNLNLNRMNT